MRSQDPLLTGLRILGYLFVYYMQMTLTKATHMSGSNTNAGEHTSRIFGGYPAKQEDTMHQVSIRYVPWEKKAGFGKGHMAGGSLIRWNVVLSAAHCFWDKDVDMMVVVMGNLDRFTKTDTLSFGIERVAMYQDYDPVTIENDIALAFLRDSVPEDSPHICPIAISTKRFENYEECQMTGWGQTEHAHAVGELLVCDVSALTLTTCKETSHIPTSYLMTGMMCAGVERSGMGACFGDSGGPMVSHRQLIGIVSWLYGEKCAKVRRPTVLTEVYCYQDWITHEINNNWSEESRINAKLRLAQCSAAKRLRDSRLMVGVFILESLFCIFQKIL